MSAFITAADRLPRFQPPTDKSEPEDYNRQSRVLRSLRAMERVDTDDVGAILRVLASKMVESGFSDLDVAAVDECIGFICGEAV